jgi:hypothetical protein
MNNKFLWLIASLFLGTLTIAACSDDDDQTGSSVVNPVNYEKTGGSGTVTATDGTKFDLNIQKCSEDNIGGVSIADGQLSVNTYQETESSYTSCYVYVEDYQEGKTEYENVSFSFSQNSGNTYASCQSIVSGTRASEYGNKLTLEKLSDGTYRFVIEGDVIYSANDYTVQNYNTPNASITVEFVMPLSAKASLAENVSNKKSMYPDFTPWLNGQTAQGAFQIEQSQLMTSGVLLWFYDTSLTYSDYKNLKEQAIKVLGEPVESYDADASDDVTGGTWTDMAVSYFYKDGNFIMVSYCPWRVEQGPDYNLPTSLECVLETHAARIQIHALEGITVDYTALIVKHW